MGTIMNARISLPLAIFAASALTSWDVAGSTFYVATSGSNIPSCGASAQPCKTITFAFNNKATAGDTIIVLPGIYTSEVDPTGARHLTLSARIKSGAPSKPITIRSQQHHQAIIDQADVPTADGAAVIITSNYVVFDGFRITRGFKGGVFIQSCPSQMCGTGVVFSHNEIDHNGMVTTDAAGHTGVYSRAGRRRQRKR